MNKKLTNDTDKQYLQLLSDILENGNIHHNERTGAGTLSVFGRQLRFKMSEGLPIITTKKMYTKGIIVELLWFLGNHMNDTRYQNLPVDCIRYLLDNNVTIWVGDCYKAYINYINDPKIGDRVIDLCIDDPVTATLRPFTKEEFIQRIKLDDYFAAEFGGIGAGYGWQWRHFGGDYTLYKQSFNSFYQRSLSIVEEIGAGIDQIAELINKLKTNPTDRRLIVSAWNPNDLNKTILPPCHYGFSCYVRELSIEDRWDLLQNKEWNKPFNQISTDDLELERICNEYNIPKYALSLMERQRSVDSFLGLPFNITSYAILLELLAKEVNMIPDELIMSLENTHIYLNHIDAVKEQLNREILHKLPTLKIENKSIFELTAQDIKIIDYKSQSAIKAKLNN